NGYLLADPMLGEALLIDAPGGIMEKVQPILAKEGCQLKELWLTHGHWDHMQDAAEVKSQTGAVIRAHQADQGLIETPEIMEGFMGQKMRLQGAKVDAWIAQGDHLKALGHEFEVRHVPGHCPGNVLFYLADAKVAFVGDALFNGGVGRWDLPGGDFEMLARSIREQIYTLPDETVVFPGHGPETTAGDEKAHNPYVSAVKP
ncbi:MAG TPA: MBL fold metallo-hydrolase, partial [Candidatus Didemnitutus sp.]|nr:MBL fold metallo-hydrolase [Candidatus Didemnitutus sp.]